MSATDTLFLAPRMSVDAGLVPYRMTIAQHLKMIEAGVFPPESRVELLGGLLVEKMIKGIPHDFSTGRLATMLREILPPAGRIVREEKSVQLGLHWRPEPDVAIVRGPDNRHRNEDPRPADIALIVEVCDTSYDRNRGAKWAGYAGAGVPAYWIVKLTARKVEAYTAPTGNGVAANYQNLANFDEAAEVPVTLDGRELGRVAVRELLV